MDGHKYEVEFSKRLIYALIYACLYACHIKSDGVMSNHRGMSPSNVMFTAKSVKVVLPKA